MLQEIFSATHFYVEQVIDIVCFLESRVSNIIMYFVHHLFDAGNGRQQKIICINIDALFVNEEVVQFSYASSYFSLSSSLSSFFSSLFHTLNLLIFPRCWFNGMRTPVQQRTRERGWIDSYFLTFRTHWMCDIFRHRRTRTARTP